MRSSPLGDARPPLSEILSVGSHWPPMERIAASSEMSPLVTPIEVAVPALARRPTEMKIFFSSSMLSTAAADAAVALINAMTTAALQSELMGELRLLRGSRRSRRFLRRVLPVGGLGRVRHALLG